MNDAPTFEAAQKELEEIVRRLESGEAPLDEALQLWQRGEELYRLCRERLDAAEGKIEELASRAEAAKP
ncbi:MAG TPA: exodeoxyribonuclease VII small subunit [Gaiellaceae bacterium]|nr:exodeoxyribonuclease VII small subunit [Gaiellaceae bacterium]